MTDEPRIKCGKCKGRHHTPAEVKACYQAARRDPFDGIPNASDEINLGIGPVCRAG